METSYTPVEWVYREVIEEEIIKETSGSIFYFCDDSSVCSEKGIIKTLSESGSGVFITLHSGVLIRVDRIITLFGKPGAAYEAYDAFSNACLDCTGGYDMDSLD
ncbi:hypothetical protein [Desertivirga arenae]|uniref:hypothetical protein n=1 Tax=Desertivirga arenae TaxID=2810309 RepID=UPI001A974F57|nr:hypothetical protein [Pedobacter sp. SYSU D00823]